MKVVTHNRYVFFDGSKRNTIFFFFLTETTAQLEAKATKRILETSSRLF